MTTIVVLLCSIAASAHDFEENGIYYNITSSTDLTVEVTYRGSYSNSYSNEYIGAVTIPETITYNSNTYRVTSIGNYAFEDCSSITFITIPEGVTSIGNYVFNGCTSLKEVIIEDGSTTLSMGYYCSYSSDVAARGLFYDCPLEEVYLGRNLSYNTGYNYGYSPFYGKTPLTSVIISDSVSSIHSYAFYGCSSLTSITIPESVTSIEWSAFSGCI